MKKQKHITPGMTLGSLFDGIGGFPYAGFFFGITPVWASEILPQAVSVTKRHFPEMEHVGDITKLDGAKLPPVDIITFGSPCQDLSTAGKRAGMKGERSGLFTEAIRIIDEMRRATNGKYPRYALWENVPGAMSSGKPAGSDFQAVLEAFTKTKIPMPASGRWAYAGMARSGGVDLAWRVLNAQFFGVPQRRRRIFLVCDFGGESAGEILFIEKGVRGDTSQGCEARQGTAADAQRGAGNTSESIAFACNQRDEVRDLHGVSGAICAQPGMKQQTFIAKGARCLNPWDTQQSRVFTGDGTSPTLAGADGGGGRNPGGLVCAAFMGQAGAKARSIGYSEKVSPTLKGAPCGFSSPCLCEPELARTLTARGDSSPCADRGQNVVAVNIPAITMRMREGCAGGGKGPLLQEEKSAALATRGDQYLFAPTAVSVHQDGNGDLSTSNTAKSLTTMSTSSCRNAPLVACGFDLQQITSKENRSSLKEVQPTLCSGGNPHIVASGVTSKGDGDCFLTPECHPALSRGGGQAGQGYPAVLETVHPDVSGTLCASGAGMSRPAGMASEPDLCVAYALQGNMIGRQEHNGPRGSGVSENTSFTLTATDTPAVAAQEPIPIQDKATRCNGGGPTRNGDGCGNGLGVGKPGDPSPTLTSADHHSVAAVFNRQRSDAFREQDIASTQAARQYKDATDIVCEADVSAVDCRNHKETGEVSSTLQAKTTPGYSLNYQNPVRTGYIVRRLTPTECERLQGFPDGWTRFGADGEEISDTRRYQMLGNSVAVPCVAFILSGVAAQLSTENTENKEDAA